MKLLSLLFLPLFSAGVIASEPMHSNQTQNDTDGDKVLDVFDRMPAEKVSTMSIEDFPIIQLSRVAGSFNNQLENGRYRIGDTVTITGMGLEKVKKPVVVIFNDKHIYNLDAIEHTDKGLSFKLNIPQGNYKVFVYSDDKRTNEIYLKPFNSGAPLIFGSTSVILTKGETFALSGVGFDNESTVQFGEQSIKPASISNEAVSFEVPKSTSARDFYVQNKSGKSNVVRVFKYN